MHRSTSVLQSSAAGSAMAGAAGFVVHSPAVKAHLVMLLASGVAWADSSVEDAGAKAKANPVAMLGPFRSLSEACGDLRDREHHCSDKPPEDGPRPEGKCAFQCRARTYRRIAKGLPPPIDELIVFGSDSFDPNAGGGINHAKGPPNHEAWLNVAARVGASWYVAAAIDPGSSWGLDGLRLLEATTVGGPLVLVRFRCDHAATTDEEDDKQSLAVVGVGPSGRPATIGPIVVRDATGSFPYGDQAETDTSETVITRSWRLEPGALVVSDQKIEETKGSRTRRRRAPPHETRYTLAFP